MGWGLERVLHREEELLLPVAIGDVRRARRQERVLGG